MIITKTPYRISFFGGGTDYPAWYMNNGGIVISSAIDKFSYITVKPITSIFDYKYRIRYYYREEVSKINHIKHPVVRECLKLFKIREGLDIIHHGDLPARTGLGSSSAFSVGLILALSKLKNNTISKKDLALCSINFEQNILSESVGSQDQVIASYGGFNKIIFNKKNIFKVNKINISDTKLKILNQWCQLIYTDSTRSAQSIAKRKIKNINNNFNLSKMKEICNEAIRVFKNSSDKEFIYEFAKLLNMQWELKKKFEKSTTNPILDKLYANALKYGSIGGKILGAGGGGFFLLITNPKHHSKVVKLLKVKQVNFKFNPTGSEIIFNEKVV